MEWARQRPPKTNHKNWKWSEYTLSWASESHYPFRLVILTFVVRRLSIPVQLTIWDTIRIDDECIQKELRNYALANQKV